MARFDCGYTGRLFEEEVLGTLHISWSRENYVPFDRAVALAIAHQNWNPSDPSSRLANDLHSEVALSLGLEDWQELHLFSSVNSPLDYFHGVDGFFEFRGRVVTFDVTTNCHKLSAKANFVLHPDDFEENRPVVARMIARALMVERRYR